MYRVLPTKILPVRIRPCSIYSKSIRLFSKENNDSGAGNFRGELDGDTYCPPLAKPLSEHPYNHPITKSLNILGITGRNNEAVQQHMKLPRHCDIVIIGGGVIGCSAAYWLQQRSPELRIVVIERDPTYTRASTVLSVGGLRQQFSLPENIQMSLYGAEFLRKSSELLAVGGVKAPDVQFQPHGYLFLASEKGAQQLAENHKLQM